MKKAEKLAFILLLFTLSGYCASLIICEHSNIPTLHSCDNGSGCHDKNQTNNHEDECTNGDHCLCVCHVPGLAFFSQGVSSPFTGFNRRKEDIVELLLTQPSQPVLRPPIV